MKRSARALAIAGLVLGSSTGCVLDGNSPDARDAREAGVFGATSPAAAAEESPLSLHPGAKRYVVLGRRSHLDIRGHDSVLGDHSITFSRWSARIETEPPRIEVDIDLRSLESSEGFVASILRDHVLEVDRYPHATLVGSLAGTGGRGGDIVIDGIADVHGKRVPLRFNGAIREEGTGYRFKASFAMSRRAFDCSYAPAEPFLDDTFHVTVDALATEERVEVQEGG